MTRLPRWADLVLVPLISLALAFAISALVILVHLAVKSYELVIALTGAALLFAGCAWALGTPDYLAYHDDEWGRPVTSVAGLYERLTLEAFQSGLSWVTILRKRENFRAAFARRLYQEEGEMIRRLGLRVD